MLIAPVGLFMRQLFVPAGFVTSNNCACGLVFERIVCACGLSCETLLCLRVLLPVSIVPAGLFMRELFVLTAMISRFYCACGLDYDDLLRLRVENVNCLCLRV